LPTTPETAQKVQIQERKPFFILHAPCTSPSLTRNRKSIFAPNFEHPNRRAKPTNTKSSKGLKENTFISCFFREPHREKKNQQPMAQCWAENKTITKKQVIKTKKAKNRGSGATPPPLSTKIGLKRNPTARV